MKIIIPGAFSGLNEFIDRNRIRRGHWSAGNDMKRHDQHVMETYIRQQVKAPLRGKIHVKMAYYSPDRKKDPDNIDAYFRKCFMDALVRTGIIAGDGWKYVSGYESTFEIDRGDPRIEVTITEGKDGKVHRITERL